VVAVPAAVTAEPAVASVSVGPPPARHSAAVRPARELVGARALAAAGEEAGLRLPIGVYANVAAALACGRHLVLTGATGAGKTTLAMAITRAATQAGRSHGATVFTGAPPPALLVEAAQQGRWVIADELHRADPEAALGALSSLLAGIPVTLADGEATPADDWRVVATWSGPPPKGPMLQRFAVVEVSGPSADDLKAALLEAAGDDATAARAAERHVTTRLGAGVLLDAARHAAVRNAAAPADEDTLAREIFAAYIAPLIDEDS
jgi:MoxR-like ATPase